MNNNNILNLRVGSYGRVLDLVNEGRVFLPVRRSLANARVLEVNNDGSVSVHFDCNFNFNGDFRSELMRFDSNLMLDNMDFDARNNLRVANGLLPLE